MENQEQEQFLQLQLLLDKLYYLIMLKLFHQEMKYGNLLLHLHLDYLHLKQLHLHLLLLLNNLH
jgi:hypothetical protein